jgi:LPXTG-site transpeptidase (sortase) family protein
MTQTAPPSWGPKEPRGIPRRASATPRSRAPLCLLLVLLGLFGLAIGLGQAVHLPFPDLSALVHPGGSAGGPTRISIPAVDVHANVVAVGQADDGSIAVPAQDPVRTAGWYRYGASPGQPGTAVIVGHVDTRTEAAVFARLPDLNRGDRIVVTGHNGQIMTFAVDSVGRTPKTAFPASTIFAPAAKPRLVLVTCGGAWVGGDVGYADNVIVYATQTSH